MKKVNSVEEYISHKSDWKKELESLRKIISSKKIEENIKWGAPVYSINGKNIVGLGAFKSYVGIWFFQGALLKDKDQKLVNAQEGKTKALRQWRFNSANVIKKESNLISSYVNEAIKNQKDGKEIMPDKNKPLSIPIELKIASSKNSKIKKCFNEFSRGKQREFT